MNVVGSSAPETLANPLWLLAELTYRCPLQCVYCSNPLEHAAIKDELSTEDWLGVLRDARALGAVQLGFSGGEPLLRRDLDMLVREATMLGYYSNLITSGMGLTAARLTALKSAGLDHIQLSFQASTQELNDTIGGAPTFARKVKAAQLIKEHGYPMVLNVVLHRYNIDRVREILDFARALDADYVELANTQYDGWAYKNRAALLPTLTQLQAAEGVVRHFRQAHGKKPRVYYVVPDYFEGQPKSCGGGWAKMMMIVTPDGMALPCHGARKLPLSFPNVRQQGLAAIWRESEAFNRYRGNAWMPEPCRSCPKQQADFGGCRCQAFLLTGDASQADPACNKSPHHGLVHDAVQSAAQTWSVPQLIYRGSIRDRAQ